MCHLIGLETMNEGAKGNDHGMVGTNDNGKEAVVTKQDIFDIKQADRKERDLSSFGTASANHPKKVFPLHVPCCSALRR